ncbi:MAG: sigma 54-interacting transcriptional regulator [Gemmatimonadota bacterium]|nr:MAG: sigma 54-interacting transcriptional regulator [Gemmatimonadota bacterium]
MALVFIDTAKIEAAVPIREAVLADGHDVRMIERAAELEDWAEGAELALILTRSPVEPEAERMRALIDARIPRPPLLALDTLGGDVCSELRGAYAVDACLPHTPTAEEVQVVLTQELERYQLQLDTGIIGRTDEIRAVLEKVNLIAPVASTVLLMGESGTGKELVARAIHRLSPRRARPFIAVNCAALPESLLESELFGHEKGAFTGATSLRRGMFELADGGTLLLDEIAEMPPATQTRLLRVLESRRFMRVGGSAEIEVNVRVVAATNRDLMAAVQTGQFRRDLYYRLNVLEISLPPLRGRRADIPVLTQRFIREFSRLHDREFKGLSPEAMGILMRYSWPGNIRELRNLIESMVVLAPGSVIRAEDFPDEIRTGSGGALLPTRSAGLPVPAAGQAGEIQPPQMEFVFRTLVELKMDVEDLKQEFDRYRAAHPELIEAAGAGLSASGIEVSVMDELEGSEPGVPTGGFPTSGFPLAAGPMEGLAAERRESIAFYPGMTMAELEREAIVATLESVGGNRRKAAERLQIGERTLYRKLKEYDIDL